MKLKYREMRKLKFAFIVFIGFVFTYCTKDNEDTIPLVVTAENALSSYLDNGDTTYHWSLESTFDLQGVKGYDLLLTSQKWREYTWVHQLTVFVPPSVEYNGTFLWITGGSINNGKVNWTGHDDIENVMFAMSSLKNSAIVSILRQTPNQPLYNNLYEDALISYTLHQFIGDGDFTWPLLFPMTKSAIRAMDAIQEFSNSKLQHQVDKFVVSGASKRGWTTWLTGASDNRVAAIAPAVIDILNMPVSLDYQVEAWGDYSPQIQDYVDLGITQEIHTQHGGDLTTMIDPYSYREKLTMPKLILLGTNDEYWPVDAIKHYYNDIPGQNFIHNVPNAGHGLGNGVQALNAVNAFFANTLENQLYPDCTWSTSESNGKVLLNVQGSASSLTKAVLWSATSADRDFRDETWSSVEISYDAAGVVNAEISYPENGYEAFYIDLEYPDINGGTYTKSTRVFVVDTQELL